MQEVVKLSLLPTSTSMPEPIQEEQNSCTDTDLVTKEIPTVEILIGNATIRFFSRTNKSQIETTLGYMGGLCHAR